MAESKQPGPDPETALPPGRGPGAPAEVQAVEGPDPARDTRAKVDRAHAHHDAAVRAQAARAVAPSGNGRPSDPDAMRQEIEFTRQRMSMTLDAIEREVVERKRELWAKATFQGFRRTVSREPWRTMAIAFVAGYIVAAIRD